MGRMSKKDFMLFLDAVLSEDKVSEVKVTFSYDNSIKFVWRPKK